MMPNEIGCRCAYCRAIITQANLGRHERACERRTAFQRAAWRESRHRRWRIRQEDAR